MREDTSENNVNNSNSNNCFCSANVALQTIIDEYTKERERGGILDNKAVTLMTILLALITVYMPIIPFDKIGTIYNSGTKNQLITIIVLIIIFFIVVVIAIVTFLKLINIVKLKTYKRVELNSITKIEYLCAREEIYQKVLCMHYKELIEHNSGNNDNKADKLNTCYQLTVVVFIFLLISCIGMKVI